MNYSSIFLIPLLLAVSGCLPPTDFEYDKKIVTTRADCKGGEIVGVWVSLSKGGMSGDRKMTLLIRSNGSGLQKIHKKNGDDTLIPFRLQYAGYGVWNGMMDDSATVQIRYTQGGEITMQTVREAPMHYGNNAIRNYYICVRSSDEAAVSQHLGARQ